MRERLSNFFKPKKIPNSIKEIHQDLLKKFTYNRDEKTANKINGWADKMKDDIVNNKKSYKIDRDTLVGLKTYEARNLRTAPNKHLKTKNR